MAIMVAIVSCREQVPPTSPVLHSMPQLKYQLFSHFPNVFWCYPDYYPVARPGVEETNSREQFPTIRADQAEFSAIREQLGLPDKADYTDDEKMQVYREHKKLRFAVQMTAAEGIYNFILRVGEGQGERIEGTITKSGDIKVLKREPSFNTCPICLTEGTLIDTPEGPVPVEELRPGMSVWTLNDSGERVAAEVLKTAVTPVPMAFQVIKISLDDGRSITASAGHPTAEGRVLGDYRVGDKLDGGLIIAVDTVAYAGATYDILPAGMTGLYWANGILLRSTLAR
ncbi:MAG: Hint domain-containing protein [Chloroflexi bacterium]|nr:Hint domain-containing protein [Chloroflexota bacterium]